MTDLEQRLEELAEHLDAPRGEGIAVAVVARLAAGPAPRRRRRWGWVLGAVLLGGAAGVAPAVGDWLGVGGVVVHRDPVPVTGQPGPLGRAIALDEVAAATGFTPLLPAALGPPDEVWLDDTTAVPVVWLRWSGGPLVAQFRHHPTDGPILGKLAHEAEVTRVAVGDGQALWVAGDHPVVVGYQRGPQRLHTASSTLLLEVGNLTVRIETDAGLAEALRLAESLPGT